MQKLSKLVFLSVLLLSVAIAVSAQEPNPNFNKELDQETPEQEKQEADRRYRKRTGVNCAHGLGRHFISAGTGSRHSNFAPISHSARRTVTAVSTAIPGGLGIHGRGGGRAATNSQCSNATGT